MRDNQLSATVDRHAVVCAERVQMIRSCDAQSCFERSGWIVEPCGNHTTDVCAGLHPGASMSLDQLDAAAALDDCRSGLKAHRATADRDDVDVLSVPVRAGAGGRS